MIFFFRSWFRMSCWHDVAAAVARLAVPPDTPDSPPEPIAHALSILEARWGPGQGDDFRLEELSGYKM
jgi:hypothetical protein